MKYIGYILSLTVVNIGLLFSGEIEGCTDETALYDIESFARFGISRLRSKIASVFDSIEVILTR